MKRILFPLIGLLGFQSLALAQCSEITVPEITSDSEAVMDVSNDNPVTRTFLYPAHNSGFQDELLTISMIKVDGPDDWVYQFCQWEDEIDFPFCRPIQPWEPDSFTIEDVLYSEQETDYDVEFIARSFGTATLELTIVREFCPEDPIIVTHTFTVEDASSIEDRPTDFTIDAAWPNPFNPVTHLPFTISAPGVVVAEVADLAGRQVALLGGQHYAAGSHDIVFEATGLASGVYLYHIRTGQETLGGRITLQK